MWVCDGGFFLFSFLIRVMVVAGGGLLMWVGC